MLNDLRIELARALLHLVARRALKAAHRGNTGKAEEILGDGYACSNLSHDLHTRLQNALARHAQAPKT